MGDQKVNIIPIIAKADTINKAELAKFKSKIMNELKSNGVSIYQFPLDDETVAEGDKEGKASSFAETYTMRRESHLQSLQEREEEMRQKFVLRVKEKEAELKEAEKELHAKFDKMKQTVADEKRVVDEQRRALDEEIADFQRRKVQYETDKMNSGHHTLGWGKKK